MEKYSEIDKPKSPSEEEHLPQSQICSSSTSEDEDLPLSQNWSSSTSEDEGLPPSQSYTSLDEESGSSKGDHQNQDSPTDHAYPSPSTPRPAVELESGHSTSCPENTSRPNEEAEPGHSTS